jgi:hypothetical protein
MSKGAITQERMEDALHYLSDTDEACAALRADMARAEWRAKRTKSAIFQISSGSVAERNAMADTSPDTEAAYEQYFKTMREFDAMKNRRATEAIVFEAWRSLNSNRRQAQ